MKRLFAAISFLTIISLQRTEQEIAHELKYAAPFFPFVGFMIGVVLCIVYFFCRFVFPLHLVATLVVCVEIILTRGFHIDGFADFFDGFFGGVDREEKLAIMKDSRMGVFGGIAILFLVLLKIQALMLFRAPEIFAVLLLMPMLSRGIVGYLIAYYPYAKEKGLGKAFEITKKEWYTMILGVFGIAMILSVSSSILLPIIFFLTKYTADYITSRLGGMTGDVYGFFIEWNELVILFILVSIISRFPSPFLFFIGGGV